MNLIKKLNLNIQFDQFQPELYFVIDIGTVFIKILTNLDLLPYVNQNENIIVNSSPKSQDEFHLKFFMYTFKQNLQHLFDIFPKLFEKLKLFTIDQKIFQIVFGLNAAQFVNNLKTLIADIERKNKSLRHYQHIIDKDLQSKVSIFSQINQQMQENSYKFVYLELGSKLKLMQQNVNRYDQIYSNVTNQNYLQSVSGIQGCLGKNGNEKSVEKDKKKFEMLINNFLTNISDQMESCKDYDKLQIGGYSSRLFFVDNKLNTSLNKYFEGKEVKVLEDMQYNNVVGVLQQFIKKKMYHRIYKMKSLNDIYNNHFHIKLDIGKDITYSIINHHKILIEYKYEFLNKICELYHDLSQTTIKTNIIVNLIELIKVLKDYARKNKEKKDQNTIKQQFQLNMSKYKVEYDEINAKKDDNPSQHFKSHLNSFKYNYVPKKDDSFQIVTQIKIINEDIILNILEIFVDLLTEAIRKIGIIVEKQGVSKVYINLKYFDHQEYENHFISFTNILKDTITDQQNEELKMDIKFKFYI